MTALQLFAPLLGLWVQPGFLGPAISESHGGPPTPSSALPSSVPASKWGGPEEWSEGTQGQADYLCLVELPPPTPVSPHPLPRVREPILFSVLQRHLADSVSKEGVEEPVMGTN